MHALHVTKVEISNVGYFSIILRIKCLIRCVFTGGDDSSNTHMHPLMFFMHSPHPPKVPFCFNNG